MTFAHRHPYKHSPVIFLYLTKDVFYTLIAITTLTVFLFLCNRFVHYLDYVATGKYAIHLLFHLIGLEIPILFALLLPLGLYLGILLSYSRLYADSEMTVLFACGFSKKQLLEITLGFSTIIMIIVALLVCYIDPIVAKQRDQMMDIAAESTIIDTILPGRFQVSQKGEKVFYVGSMSRDRKKMHDIFVVDSEKYGKSSTPHLPNWILVAANQGYQWIDHQTGAHYMVAQDGYRYRGIPGRKDFEIIKFGTYGIQINTPQITGRHEGEEVIPTFTLFSLATKGSHYMAELQWRLSMPLSVMILSLLALVLSEVKPRHGRFTLLVPAVLLYILYANMLFVSRSALANHQLPAWIGLGWVHIILLLLALILLRKRFR